MDIILHHLVISVNAYTAICFSYNSSNYLAFSNILCYNINSYRLWQRGGDIMNWFLSIATVIVGNIASYYIIKWLDGRK